MPPAYLHHFFPVHGTAAFPPTDRIRPRGTFAVQVRLLGEHPWRRALDREERLERAIQARAPLDRRRPDVVVSVLVDEERSYVGISRPALNLSPWIGGAWPFPADRERINRAELKLLEALETFRIRLQPGWNALDLGSGTGGWARILLQSGLSVTAVDPRPLELEHPRLLHHALPAEGCLREVEGPFDLITNDMSARPQDSAPLMVQYAAHLRPGGHAVMTVKLGALDKPRVLDHTLRILRSAYRIPRIRQLYYNRSDLTVWLRKSGQ